MNRMKFNACLKEFPFLKELVDQQRDPINCDGIKVARISQDLISQTPHYEGATGSLVGIDNGERFDFVLRNGQIIKDAVRASGDVVHNEAHTENENYDGETILEAIDRAGVVDTLEYIIKMEYGYNIRDHHSQGNYRMTVYKEAKVLVWLKLQNDRVQRGQSFSLAEAIAAANEEALSQVKAEATF